MSKDLEEGEIEEGELPEEFTESSVADDVWTRLCQLVYWCLCLV